MQRPHLLILCHNVGYVVHDNTQACTHARTHAHTQTVLRLSGFCPEQPGPKETFTHSHLSWSSIIPYLLPPSITIHSIFPCSIYVPDSLFPQSLSGALSCSLMPHIHLTILISAHWRVISFSFLMGHAKAMASSGPYANLHLAPDR